MIKDRSRIARTLRFVCDYLLGATFVGILIYLGWILVLLVSPTVHSTGGTWVGVGFGPPGLSLPVTIDPSVSGTFSDAGLFNATGQLIVKTRDRRIQLLGCTNRILLSLLILGLAYLTRQFLVDVIDGTPFTFDNARRLKWIGWLLLGAGGAKPILDMQVGSWVLSIVKVQNPILSPPIKVDPALILVAVFVLILSAAFRHGVELEQERSLTV
jgi:hypothetical protein